jgi:hypothetical protein
MRTDTPDQMIFFVQSLLPVMRKRPTPPAGAGNFPNKNSLPQVRPRAGEESSRAGSKYAPINRILRFAQNDPPESAAVTKRRVNLLRDHGCHAGVWIRGDDLRAGADAAWLPAVPAKAATLVQAGPDNHRDTHA